MAKVTIEGAIFLYLPLSTPEKPVYAFNTNRIAGELFLEVCPHTIEFEPPADFDPVPAQISALNEAKRKLQLETAAKLSAIEEQISKLSSITYMESV